MNKRETLSNMLIKLRKKQNLNQKEFAEKMGVSQSNLSKWERCITLPDYDNLCNIADKLGVTTDYLLGQTTVRNDKEEKEKNEIEAFIDDIKKVLESSIFDNLVVENLMLYVYTTAILLKSDDKALAIYKNYLEKTWRTIHTCVTTIYANDTALDRMLVMEEIQKSFGGHIKKDEKFVLRFLHTAEGVCYEELNNLFVVFEEKAKTVPFDETALNHIPHKLFKDLTPEEIAAHEESIGRQDEENET